MVRSVKGLRVYRSGDEDLPDVLLHVTCLRHGGFQTAYEGARVVCEVVRSPKGLKAFRIFSMDDPSIAVSSALVLSSSPRAAGKERW